MIRLLAFITLTCCCWGSYGPVLHEGQMGMEGSRLRPFIAVGIAYFLVAVVVPLMINRGQPEQGRWTFSGIAWSLVAGTIGALGSLGIILAFNFGGKPVYVMPLVFGCAPVVNTFVTMAPSVAGIRPSPVFFAAIVLVALGAAGVLRFKPKPANPHGSPAVVVANDTKNEIQDGAANQKQAGEQTATKDSDPEQAAPGPTRSDRILATLGAIASLVMTVLCWGSYGPLLHLGQTKMEGSRLRPFICVGIAYLFVAIVIPLMILSQWTESGEWTWTGSLWSLLAGALGAVGALGVIMAFNCGGKPVLVMPLVFGGAPVINTLTSMLENYFRTNAIGSLSSQFLASLTMVIVGAMLVMIFAPRGAPPKQAKTREATEESLADPADTAVAPQAPVAAAQTAEDC